MNAKEIEEILTAHGVPASDAATVADCFVTADAYGVTSHGTAILPAHIDRIDRGGYNLAPRLATVKESPSFAVIDSDNAMGPVSAMHCMRYAIKKAEEYGMFTVFSRNGNTFGPAFYYPLKAAEKGYIGIVCSNSPAQMAPMGGKEKMLGTNPFSAVIPVPGSDPVIIDMATSVVAKSKFKEYKKAGKLLPDGWALDREGNPTNDPDKAMEGFVLPMAGFKGYAIAMLIDVVAGLLPGAAFLNEVGRFYCDNNKSMNVGFCMTVIDPKIIYGGEWPEAIRGYVHKLRSAAAIDGKKVLLPGDDRINFLHTEKR